jgi:anthranilate phosphoribosyltransferase
MSGESDTVIRDALQALVSGAHLDVEMARSVMDRIMDGAATPAQIGALLTALRVRGETVEELTGMVLSMREHAVRVELKVAAVDTCGTGGDGSGTFNISTAAAFVVAAAGAPVAKHGNRAASSRCGSADVLEALGVTIALPAKGVQRCVEETGIGFLFAPAFHPAMRHAAAARSELGIRTVFNVVGPLANPARVRHQALGVGDPRLAPVMAGVLHRLGHRRALVFTGPDGVDELVLHGPARCWDVSPDGIHEYELDPQAHGLAAAPLAALRGGDAATNAARIRGVFSGERGPARDVVVFNAAAALVAAEHAADIAEGIGQASDALDSGAAARRLDDLVRVSAVASA